MATTSCIHRQAESAAPPVQLTCLHVRFARRAETAGEFKSKFGVRSGVHLSVHLRSVMRSAESFSREKHLITASVLRAPVAFEKGAKSLFSRSSEGKLITSTQTPGRDWEVSERMELHGWHHCQRPTRSCRELCPSAFIATTRPTFSFQFNCKQDLTLQTFVLLW